MSILNPDFMNLKFDRLVQFSLLVKAGGRLREFNFRKLRDIEQDTFTVNVCDDRGERVLFTLLRENGNWKIVPGNLPPWITQSESSLGLAVDEELRNW